MEELNELANGHMIFSQDAVVLNYDIEMSSNLSRLAEPLHLILQRLLTKLLCPTEGSITYDSLGTKVTQVLAEMAESLNQVFSASYKHD